MHRASCPWLCVHDHPRPLSLTSPHLHKLVPWAMNFVQKPRIMLDATHVHSQLVTNGRHVVFQGVFYCSLLGISRWVHVCHVSLPTHQRCHKTGPWRRTNLCPYIKHVMCLLDNCDARLRPRPLAVDPAARCKRGIARARQLHCATHVRSRPRCVACQD